MSSENIEHVINENTGTQETPGESQNTTQNESKPPLDSKASSPSGAPEDHPLTQWKLRSFSLSDSGREVPERVSYNDALRPDLYENSLETPPVNSTTSTLEKLFASPVSTGSHETVDLKNMPPKGLFMAGSNTPQQYQEIIPEGSALPDEIGKVRTLKTGEWVGTTKTQPLVYTAEGIQQPTAGEPGEPGEETPRTKAAREKFLKMKLLRDSGKSEESRECRLERNDSPPEHLFEEEESIFQCNLKNILIFLTVFIGIATLVILLIWSVGGFKTNNANAQQSGRNDDPDPHEGLTKEQIEHLEMMKLPKMKLGPQKEPEYGDPDVRPWCCGRSQFCCFNRCPNPCASILSPAYWIAQIGNFLNKWNGPVGTCIQIGLVGGGLMYLGTLLVDRNAASAATYHTKTLPDGSFHPTAACTRAPEVHAGDCTLPENAGRSDWRLNWTPLYKDKCNTFVNQEGMCNAEAECVWTPDTYNDGGVNFPVQVRDPTWELSQTRIDAGEKECWGNFGDSSFFSFFAYPYWMATGLIGTVFPFLWTCSCNPWQWTTCQNLFCCGLSAICGNDCCQYCCRRKAMAHQAMENRTGRKRPHCNDPSCNL